MVAQCGVYTGALAKIARDVALLMQPEVGEVAAPGGGSSAMPGKRNPSGPAIALAAAARVPGLVAGYLGAMAQEHERAVGGWQSEWQTVADVVEATAAALAAMAATVEGLTVNAERMRANRDARPAAFAEQVAMRLAPEGGRAAAQEAVAREVEAGTLRPDGDDKYLGSAENFRKRLLEDTECQ